MKRTQIYLSEAQIESLKTLSEAWHVDVSQLIREAIDRNYRTGYDPEDAREALHQAAGLWGTPNRKASGVSYQRRLRRAWRGTPIR